MFFETLFRFSSDFTIKGIQIGTKLLLNLCFGKYVPKLGTTLI